MNMKKKLEDMQMQKSLHVIWSVSRQRWCEISLLLLLIILDLTSTLVDSCESIYVRYVWEKNL
jgi:hypothetical protein